MLHLVAVALAVVADLLAEQLVAGLELVAWPSAVVSVSQRILGRSFRSSGHRWPAVFAWRRFGLE